MGGNTILTKPHFKSSTLSLVLGIMNFIALLAISSHFFLQLQSGSALSVHHSQIRDFYFIKDIGKRSVWNFIFGMTIVPLRQV